MTSTVGILLLLAELLLVLALPPALGVVGEDGDVGDVEVGVADVVMTLVSEPLTMVMTVMQEVELDRNTAVGELLVELLLLLLGDDVFVELLGWLLPGAEELVPPVGVTVTVTVLGLSPIVTVFPTVSVLLELVPGLVLLDC